MQDALETPHTIHQAEPTEQANDIDFLVASLRETARLMARGEPIGADTAAA